MIHDLCIIMLTAGVTSLLFKLFKQPVVLGYIVAGLFTGPYMFGASWIDDAESVEMWGQIGVLFLLFAMGLEFSFKKLIAMGSTALIAAGTVVVGMMSVGFIAGRLMGWDEMNALFLGGMLCMSSTTIVFKAIDDMKLSSHKFASVAMGILIVEDLFAVVLMVILSSIAVEKHLSGNALLTQVGTLAVYLILWFVLGIYLLPTFFRKFKKHLNDETLTIFAIGLCLGMVLLSIGAGFSSALGAFVMGSILAETLEAEKIERLVAPVKNIFGAVFFVSVGMMIQPHMLVEYWLPIMIITLLVIAGQIFFATTGTLLSGQSLKISMQTGFCLVQVGEFAFIIAQFGQSSGVTDASLYPIVVAVSVITTFLTPYIMKLSGPAEAYVTAHMSSGLKMVLDNYYQSRNTITIQPLWHKHLKRSLTTVAVNFICVLFICIFYLKYAYPWLMEQSRLLIPLLTPRTAIVTAKIVSVAVLIAAISPFIYNIAARRDENDLSRAIWYGSGTGKIYLSTQWGLRWLLAVATVAYIIYHTFSLTTGFVVGIALITVVAVMVSRVVRRHSRQMLENFNNNLTAREQHADRHRAIDKHFVSSLLAYDVHIATVELPQNSTYSGKTLRELNVRQSCGGSIVRIIRDDICTNIPGGGKHIYPGDRIVVAGTDEQIDRFKQMIDQSIRKKSETQKYADVCLEHFTVEAGSAFVGQSVMDSGIRDKAGCIVMGIERGEEYIMNPEPTIILQEGDSVLVAGETERLRNFLAQVGK